MFPFVTLPGRDQQETCVQAALRAAKDGFAREYSDGTIGMVLPGVIAVDNRGHQLSKIALLPAGHIAPDSLYTEIMEEAFAPLPQVARDAVAYAAVRIDIGWPRIIAWYRHSPIACASKPQFTGDQLTGWADEWGEVLSASIPTGPREGLIELSADAAFGLLVQARIAAGAMP